MPNRAPNRPCVPICPAQPPVRAQPLRLSTRAFPSASPNRPCVPNCPTQPPVRARPITTLPGALALSYILRLGIVRGTYPLAPLFASLIVGYACAYEEGGMARGFARDGVRDF